MKYTSSTYAFGHTHKKIFRKALKSHFHWPWLSFWKDDTIESFWGRIFSLNDIAVNLGSVGSKSLSSKKHKHRLGQTRALIPNLAKPYPLPSANLPTKILLTKLFVVLKLGQINIPYKF